MSGNAPVLGTFAAVALLAAASRPAAASDRVLRATLVLEAPVETVWALWTTEDGVKSFFAPGCRIEPRVDGLYEIWFNPAAPAGERGADGMRILSFEPNRRLVFTWNAPPSIPTIRGQRTAVEVKLAADPSAPKKTRLTFTHFGWGEGEDWDKAYAYFDKAWNGFVLPNLAWRVANGPIDWSKKPEVRPVAPSLRVELAPR